MRGFVREFCYLGSLALLLALMLAASPLFAWSVGASQPTPRTKNSVQLPPKHHLRTGLTKGYVNVRSQASANGKLLATYPPGTKVTIYSAVSGQLETRQPSTLHLWAADISFVWSQTRQTCIR
jgi:hypothetical protein